MRKQVLTESGVADGGEWHHGKWFELKVVCIVKMNYLIAGAFML